jgi:hypothetical protein
MAGGREALMTEPSKVPVYRLVLIPAAITLAVTVLRVTGELLRWSPSLFNREAGGGGALVGIVWLIPLFGIYFALKLAAAGLGPASVRRTLGWAGLAFVINTALGFGSFAVVKSPVAQLGIFTVTSWLAIFVAMPGWPALWRVLLAYGFAARIPVLVVMFMAIFGGWDSHYAKPRGIRRLMSGPAPASVQAWKTPRAVSRVEAERCRVAGSSQPPSS